MSIAETFQSTSTITHNNSISETSNATLCLSKSKDDIPSALNTAVLSLEDQTLGDDLPACFKELDKAVFLKSIYFVLDNGLVFTDKLLPDPLEPLLSQNLSFSKDYYVNLHYEV